MSGEADQSGTANYGQDCTQHVLSALKAGYRYLDGAQQYRNTASTKDALKAWGGKREDVYILTKCMSASFPPTLELSKLDIERKIEGVKLIHRWDGGR